MTIKGRLMEAVLSERQVAFLRWARNVFGARVALTSLAESVALGGRFVKVPVRGHDRSVFIRPGTIDQTVYEDIFLSGSYRSPLDAAEYVIDAGGHAGLATVFYRLAHPRAEIVVIEPDDGNLEVLRLNVSGDPAIHVHRGGLWGRAGALSIRNPEDSSWGLQTVEGGELPAYTVDRLLELHGWDRVDILKIDIEGSEVEVFSTAAPWIGRVGSLVVELHDRFREGCAASLDEAVGRLRHQRYEQGENTIVVFEDAKGPARSERAPAGGHVAA